MPDAVGSQVVGIAPAADGHCYWLATTAAATARVERTHSNCFAHETRHVSNPEELGAKCHCLGVGTSSPVLSNFGWRSVKPRYEQLRLTP